MVDEATAEIEKMVERLGNEKVVRGLEEAVAGLIAHLKDPGMTSEPLKRFVTAEIKYIDEVIEECKNLALV